MGLYADSLETAKVSHATREASQKVKGCGRLSARLTRLAPGRRPLHLRVVSWRTVVRGRSHASAQHATGQLASGERAGAANDGGCRGRCRFPAHARGGARHAIFLRRPWRTTLAAAAGAQDRGHRRWRGSAPAPAAGGGLPTRSSEPKCGGATGALRGGWCVAPAAASAACRDCRRRTGRVRRSQHKPYRLAKHGHV